MYINISLFVQGAADPLVSQEHLKPLIGAHLILLLDMNSLGLLYPPYARLCGLASAYVPYRKPASEGGWVGKRQKPFVYLL